MSDAAAHAKMVKDHVARLNLAISGAFKVGLRVELDVSELNSVGRGTGMPHVTARVSKEL